MGKKNMSLTIEEELWFRLEEYKRNIDPSFNRSQYIENCFKSLISESDDNFAEREELLKEKEDLTQSREEKTKRIALINAKLDNMNRRDSKEKQETLKQKEMMYDTMKVHDDFEL